MSKKKKKKGRKEKKKKKSKICSFSLEKLYCSANN